MAEQPRRVDASPIKDPGVAHGAYRPLQRTDGKYIVYCDEHPPARRTVGGRTFDTLALADAFARECAAQPPPCPAPAPKPWLT